jgi:hypothetical protein
MSEHVSGKIRPSEDARKVSNVRPTCPKCNGLLLPETTLSGDGETALVVSVGCVNCGERFFRGHQRRRPGIDERIMRTSEGSPSHKGPRARA